MVQCNDLEARELKSDTGFQIQIPNPQECVHLFFHMFWFFFHIVLKVAMKKGRRERGRGGDGDE